MQSRARELFQTGLLFLALAVVTLNAFFAVRAIRVLLNSEYWGEHTWQVIYSAEVVMGSAKDAETGSRGYMISGDPTYLQPYTAAINNLPEQVDALESLTRDNRPQQDRIVFMKRVLAERLELVRQSVALRQAGDLDSMRALILSGTGKAQMDLLRGIARDIEIEERRLLRQRTAETERNARRAKFTVVLASILDLLLIVFLFRYLHRERLGRTRSEQIAGQLSLARAETEARAEEIRNLNVTLEERVRVRTAELETTNRELEAFSYSVSHDLRAPLRTIDGFSLALQEDYMDVVGETGSDYIRRVRAGVQRMGQLIDALLQLSRITRAEINREDFSVSDLAESVATDITEAEPDRQFEIRVQPGLRANADPRLVRVALENLLGNAAKFTSKLSHGEVEFGWDPEGKAWFVRDNGAGFDMYYADRLFNAFNRLHGDKDFKGSGIGLATVARVVRRHHGRIWADSSVDHGATFWFTLG